MTKVLSINEEYFGMMVDTVLSWFNETTEEICEEFRQCLPSDLVKYHHSLGRDIRNEFNLSSYEHTPEIINGMDMSEDHPDNISMRVIEEVHRRLQ